MRYASNTLSTGHIPYNPWLQRQSCADDGPRRLSFDWIVGRYFVRQRLVLRQLPHRHVMHPPYAPALARRHIPPRACFVAANSAADTFVCGLQVSGRRDPCRLESAQRNRNAHLRPVCTEYSKCSVHRTIYFSYSCCYFRIIDCYRRPNHDRTSHASSHTWAIVQRRQQ